MERGPLTVIEDGEYAGEAMVPFTGPGAEVYLAYAVDLGVKVTEEPSSERVLSTVNIFRGMLSVQEYDIQRVKYRVENNNARGATVMIEHPRLNDYTPFETPEPAESTADAYRYPVSADAHAVATFTAQQRRLVARREEIRNQKLAQLQRWLRDKVLDDKTFAALQKILALYDQIADLEAKLKKNDHGGLEREDAKATRRSQARRTRRLAPRMATSWASRFVNLRVFVLQTHTPPTITHPHLMPPPGALQMRPHQAKGLPGGFDLQVRSC